MIDIHSHILPEIDHGSLSIEDSLLQLKKAADIGVKHLAVTPHFYPQRTDVDSFLENREYSLELLSKEDNYGVEILPGAEIRLSIGISNNNDLDKLTYLNTNTLLIEMPFSDWNNLIINEVQAIQDKGFEIILAHVERYDTKQLMKLSNYNLNMHFNAYSLKNLSDIMKINRLVKSGHISLVASDSHIYNYDTAYNYLKKSSKFLGKDFNKFMNNAKKLLSV